MKITVFNTSLLRKDVVHGFFNQVVEHLRGKLPGIPDYAEEFVRDTEAFNQVMKPDTGINSSDIESADAEADSAWSGLNNYLRAMCGYPDDAVREAADICYDIFSAYENPTNKSYSEEYAALGNIIRDLEAINPDVRAKCMLDLWLSSLKSSVEKFESLYIQFTEDKMRGIGVVKEARMKAIQSYRMMVEDMNYELRRNPTPELEAFAMSLNDMINVRKAALKAEKTRAAADANDDNNI